MSNERLRDVVPDFPKKLSGLRATLTAAVFPQANATGEGRNRERIRVVPHIRAVRGSHALEGMTTTEFTDHRDDLRTRIAGVALFACGCTHACFLLILLSVLNSGDLDEVAGLMVAAAIMALATPLLAAVGSIWGRGPHRTACTTVLMITGSVVALIVLVLFAA